MTKTFEKIQEYVLPILVVFIPFMVLAKGLLHYSHHLAMILFSCVLLGAMTANIWLFALSIYVSTWILFLFWKSLTVFGCADRAILGMDQLLYIIGGLIFFIAGRTYKFRLATIYNTICVAAIAQATLAILQFLGLNLVDMVINIFVPAKGKMADGTILGTLGNPNFLAAYLAITLPFFFRKGWSWFIPAIAFLLVRSWTSAAVVPAMAASLWFFWDNEYVKKFRGLMLPLAGVVILGYVCLMDTPFWVSPRWRYWALAMAQLDTVGKIIFGLGPGAHWAKEFPLHSEWVTIIHQLGIVGLVLCAGYAFTLSRRNRFLFAAMVIALINALGNYNLHLAPSAALICMIGGMVERSGAIIAGPDSSWGNGI